MDAVASIRRVVHRRNSRKSSPNPTVKNEKKNRGIAGCGGARAAVRSPHQPTLPDSRRRGRLAGRLQGGDVNVAAASATVGVDGPFGPSRSLIGHCGSSAFRLSTTAVSMSLTGSRFSSESAPIGGLAVTQTAGPSGHANSPHPSSREGHHSTARWSSMFLLSYLTL